MSSLVIMNTNILSQEADAIVNDAPSNLFLGRSTLANVAGSKLQEYCERVGYCPIGSAVITPAFELPARYIIHAVSPIYRDGKQDEEKLLRNTYRKILELAEHNACHVISMPLLSAERYPTRKAWSCALHTCYRYIYQFHFDIDIRFTVEDLEIYKVGCVIDGQIDPAKAPVKLYHPIRRETK